MWLIEGNVFTNVSDDLVVIKIGGSCLKNNDSYRGIAKKISEIKDKKLVLVLSAKKGETNKILERYKDIPKKELDSKLASGEIASVVRLSKELSDIGVSNSIFTPYHNGFPIITDDNYCDALPLINESKNRLADIKLALNKNYISIV